jgi:hypothetical protein
VVRSSPTSHQTLHFPLLGIVCSSNDLCRSCHSFCASTAFLVTTASRTSEYIPFSLECKYVVAMHELESHLFNNEVSLA